jgi:hypothetical protein
MHDDPHFDPHGACECECDACSTEFAGNGWCTCPDCNQDACDLHPPAGLLPS